MENLKSYFCILKRKKKEVFFYSRFTRKYDAIVLEFEEQYNIFMKKRALPFNGL